MNLIPLYDVPAGDCFLALAHDILPNEGGPFGNGYTGLVAFQRWQTRDNGDIRCTRLGYPGGEFWLAPNTKVLS